MSADALYVYAVTEASSRADWGTGVDGCRVETITQDRLAALVHQSPPTPYTGSEEQVRRWVIEHSDVVERAWEAVGTVLPVTFDVLVAPTAEMSAAERLRHWLRDHADSVHARLAALRDRAELKVELALDCAVALPLVSDQPELVSMRAELASRPPGVRRLLEKKLELAERVALDARADALAELAISRLSAIAEQSVRHRKPRRGSDERPVAALSLLVPREGVEAIGAELGALQHEHAGLRIRFLGPWPPYSFADLQIEA